MGDLLVLAAAAVYSLQIVLMERYAPRYDALAFTMVEMLVSFAGLGILAAPQLAVPHGWTVWGALLVTGIVASALAFLVQTWAQRQTSATRTALVFTLEPVWAALFGYTLAGDRSARRAGRAAPRSWPGSRSQSLRRARHYGGSSGWAGRRELGAARRARALPIPPRRSRADRGLARAGLGGRVRRDDGGDPLRPRRGRRRDEGCGRDA